MFDLGSVSKLTLPLSRLSCYKVTESSHKTVQLLLSHWNLYSISTKSWRPVTIIFPSYGAKTWVACHSNRVTYYEVPWPTNKSLQLLLCQWTVISMFIVSQSLTNISPLEVKPSRSTYSHSRSTNRTHNSHMILCLVLSCWSQAKHQKSKAYIEDSMKIQRRNLVYLTWRYTEIQINYSNAFFSNY